MTALPDTALYRSPVPDWSTVVSRTSLIVEEFFGRDASKIFSRLSTLTAKYERGYSMSGYLNEFGKLTSQVVESSGLLNVKRFTLPRWIIEKIHRLLLRGITATVYFAQDLTLSVPIVSSVTTTVLRWAKYLIACLKRILYPVIVALRLAVKLIKAAFVSFPVYLYRRLLKPVPIIGYLSVFIVKWIPVNLRFTLPYERKALIPVQIIVFNIAWILLWLILAIFTLVFPLTVLAIAIIIALIAAAIAAVNFWLVVAAAVGIGIAVASVPAWAVTSIAVIAAGIVGVAFPPAAAGIVAAVPAIIAGLAGAGVVVAVIIIAVDIFFAIVTAVTIIGLVSLVFFLAMLPIIITLIAMIGPPLLSFLLLIPAFITHYLVCVYRAKEVELYGTFAAPFYSDATRR